MVSKRRCNLYLRDRCGTCRPAQNTALPCERMISRPTVFVLLLMLTGCASVSHEAASTEDQTPPAATSSTANPAELSHLDTWKSIQQRREADRALLSDPQSFRSELQQATLLFDECVDEHIAIYLSTSVAPELAARTTVVECGPRRWQPIVDLLDRAEFAGVKVDRRAIRDEIQEQAHQRVLSALEKHST